jgi:DNA-binding NarL/FixJ family response regulator
MIKVLLADDHQLMRQGVRRILESEADIQVVGEASDGLEVQMMAADLQPDVILMDVSMGIVDGISATRQLLRQAPWLKIVMLTMHSHDGHLFQALQAGATGYILKTAGADQVLNAVRAAAAGGSVIAPALAGKVLNEFRRMASKLDVEDGLGQLTETEMQILQLVASGRSNKEIATRMVLAESTVKNRLSVLFQKINVADRTQAAIYAITHGLAPIDLTSQPGTVG